MGWSDRKLWISWHGSCETKRTVKSLNLLSQLSNPKSSILKEGDTPSWDTVLDENDGNRRNGHSQPRANIPHAIFPNFIEGMEAFFWKSIAVVSTLTVFENRIWMSKSHSHSRSVQTYHGLSGQATEVLDQMDLLKDKIDTTHSWIQKHHCFFVHQGEMGKTGQSHLAVAPSIVQKGAHDPPPQIIKGSPYLQRRHAHWTNRFRSIGH